MSPDVDFSLPPGPIKLLEFGGKLIAGTILAGFGAAFGAGACLGASEVEYGDVDEACIAAGWPCVCMHVCVCMHI
jgi:hypothetical protein